jgi:hypothetical protein
MNIEFAINIAAFDKLACESCDFSVISYTEYNKHYTALMSDFIRKYEITAVKNISRSLIAECSEENYLLIRLTCPELIRCDK